MTGALAPELRLLRLVGEGKCPECAVAHGPGEPHNRDSLFYQMAFREDHGRWPTWEDAMAHCSPGTREAWRRQLDEMGIKADP